jgi:endoglycosylceramidase
MNILFFLLLLFQVSKQQNIYHGVNVVYKGHPWHPNVMQDNIYTSFTENDVIKLQSYGFNVVRLGIMWPGVEPHENFINTTYLEVMKSIALNLEKHNISVILDFHQDVLSNYFCGEGVPNWLVPKLISNDTINSFPSPLSLLGTIFTKPIPTINECKKHDWITYHFTYATSQAFQSLYDNPQYIRNYWINVANTFKDSNNIIGYELFNEPWAGDIFNHPSLLFPKVAARRNLIKFFDEITDYIRSVDNNPNHKILFESITWDIFKVGFDRTPLDSARSSMLAYHAYYPPNINPYLLFKYRIADTVRLNVSGIITEFDVGIERNPSKSKLKTLNKFLDLSKKYNLSWMTWGYKSFYNITGDYNGFYNEDYSTTEGANLLISYSKNKIV